MDIVLTVPSLDRAFGGPTRKARDLAAALRSQGHRVILVGVGAAAGDGEVGLPRISGFRGTPIPWRLDRVAAAAATARVVHILGYRDPVGTTAALAARRAGVPYVLEPAGMLRPRLRSVPLKRAHDATIGRFVVGGATKVVATSTQERDECLAWGCTEGQVAVRPNGVLVPTTLPPAGALRGRWDIPGAAPLVLALGRLTAKKGLVTLVESVAEIPGAHLVIAGPDGGDGTLRNVQAVRGRLGLADRVHVEPRGLWDDERTAAFVDADVVCLPSLHENFGAVPLEAAACGVPSVLSPQVGAVEWLGDGCLVAKDLTPDGVRTALCALLHDPERRRRLGRAARAAAESLTWRTVAARQAALYEVMLG
jgi:glycosyltransferase involved in cell wall biosynthesis